MLSPQISVIVPCYNQAQFLPEALNSIVKQTYDRWECIIVNDGSPDNTEEVALQWCEADNRIIYFKKENGGLSSARNAGIKVAKGKYILPLDADDYIGSEYLELAMNAFGNDDSLDLVYCKAQKFGFVNCIWDLPAYSYKGLLLDNIIFCSSIYKRSITAGISYDESLKHGLEDWDFWLQILNPASKVYQIPSIQFCYRIKELSMLVSMNEEYKEAIRWKIFLKHMDQFKSFYSSPIKAYINSLTLSTVLGSESYKIGNSIINFFSKISRRSKK